MSRRKGCPSPWPRRRAMRRRCGGGLCRYRRHATAIPGIASVARAELARLKGPLYGAAVAAVGQAYVDKNIETWEAMQKVLDSGRAPSHSSARVEARSVAGDVERCTSMKAWGQSIAETTQGRAERRGRKASKEVRQLQLIEATIDSLAKRGYAETTMADVADGAGLSRGIVNFHFESKEKLLIATLQHMSDEYSRALARRPAEGRRAIRRAQLQAIWSPPISTARSATSASSPPGAPSGARPSRGRPIRRCAGRATRTITSIFIELCAALRQSGLSLRAARSMALAPSAPC